MDKKPKHNKKEKPLPPGKDTTASPAAAVTGPAIVDPIGCCRYPNGAGGITCDDDVRQSECLKKPGSRFTPNGRCN
jgi:hypothetical protein